MSDKEMLMEQLRTIAFGEASDASGSELKSAGKLKAIELLGKLCGIFDDAARGEAKVIIIEDV